MHANESQGNHDNFRIFIVLDAIHVYTMLDDIIKSAHRIELFVHFQLEICGSSPETETKSESETISNR